MKRIYLALALSASTQAWAQFAPNEGPNNTNTQVISAVSLDNVVSIERGHLFQHLYGQDLYLFVNVANVSAEKRFYIVDETTHENWALEYAFNDAWRVNAAIQWRGTDRINRDHFILRVKGSHFPGHRYALYVVMNGQTFAAKNIVLR